MVNALIGTLPRLYYAIKWVMRNERIKKGKDNIIRIENAISNARALIGEKELPDMQDHVDLLNLEMELAEATAVTEAMEKLNTHKNFRSTRPAIAIKDIISHASRNVEKIVSDGKVTTVSEALTTGKISFTTTPQGLQNNIFFSPPGSRITPFLLSVATHVIEVDTRKALAENLFGKDSARKLYFSPHLSAFKYERVDTPVVLLGNDRRQWTVYRVYHLNINGQPSKLYQYDYHSDGMSVLPSTQELVHRDDEFYQGINTPVYRLIDRLRMIKGPLEDSYADYVWENFNNPIILNTCRGVLFSVLNMEAKVTESFSVSHPAVKIRTHDYPKYQSLGGDVLARISELIKRDQLVAFGELLYDLGLKKEQLDPVLLSAIQAQKENWVKILLAKGVPTFPGAFLKTAMEEMYNAYFVTGHDVEAKEFKTARNVVALLLEQGSNDEDDAEHIRYVQSADDLAPQNSGLWNNTSKESEKLLKKYLKFADLDTQKLIVSNVNKYLQELYEFTFNYAMFNLHWFIAKRLGKPPLYEEQTSQILLGYVEKNNVDEIKKSFAMSQVAHDTLYYLFSFAIKSGKTEVVSVAYPFVKDLVHASAYPPIHMALYYKQHEVVKALMQLGANFQTPDPEYILNIPTVLYLAIISDCQEAIDRMNHFSQLEIARGLDTAALLGRATLFKTLLEKYGVTPFMFPSETLGKANLEIWTIYLEYRKKRIFPSPFREELFYYTHAMLDRAQYEKFCYFLDNIFDAYVENQDLSINTLVQMRMFLEKSINKDVCYLNYIFEKIASEAPSNLSEHNLIKQMTSKGVFTSSSENILHLVAFTADVAKIKLVRTNLPSLSLGQNPFFFRKVILQPDAINRFSILIEQGLLSLDTDETVAILGEALYLGNKDIITWLLQRESLTQNGKNDILQLLVDYYAKNRYLSKPDSFYGMEQSKQSSFKQAFADLCQELNFDINQKVREDTTLLGTLISREELSQPEQVILDYLLESDQTDLRVKNKIGNTILHTIATHEQFPRLIKRYISQQGNINAENKCGLTAAEELTYKSSEHIPQGNPYQFPDKYNKYKKHQAKFSNAIALLKEHQVFVRPYIYAIEFGLITYSDRKDLYLLVHNDNIFLHDLSNFNSNKAHQFEINLDNDSIQLLHHHRGIFPANQQPDMNRNVPPNSLRPFWVKMPRSNDLPKLKLLQLEETLEVYPIDCGGKEFAVSRLTVQLISYIDQFREKFLNDRGLGKKTKGIAGSVFTPYSVPANESALMRQSVGKLIGTLEAIYKPIFTKAPVIQYSDEEYKQMHAALSWAGIPFSVKLLISDPERSENDFYWGYDFYSPLIAAVVSEQKEWVEKLVEAFPLSVSQAIKLAINLHQEEILQIIVNKSKIEEPQIFSYLSELKYNDDSLKGCVVILFKLLPSYDLPPKSLAKYKQWATRIFSRDPDFKKQLVAILNKESDKKPGTDDKDENTIKHNKRRKTKVNKDNEETEMELGKKTKRPRKSNDKDENQITNNKRRKTKNDEEVKGDISIVTLGKKTNIPLTQHKNIIEYSNKNEIEFQESDKEQNNIPFEKREKNESQTSLSSIDSRNRFFKKVENDEVRKDTFLEREKNEVKTFPGFFYSSHSSKPPGNLINNSKDKEEGPPR